MFPGDDVCEQVLIADNVNKTGKIKILRTTGSVYRRSDTVKYTYDVKGKKTSGTSWYWGIPRFQYGVRSDSSLPTSNHKSGG